MRRRLAEFVPKEQRQIPDQRGECFIILPTRLRLQRNVLQCAVTGSLHPGKSGHGLVERVADVLIRICGEYHVLGMGIELRELQPRLLGSRLHCLEDLFRFACGDGTLDHETAQAVKFQMFSQFLASLPRETSGSVSAELPKTLLDGSELPIRHMDGCRAATSGACRKEGHPETPSLEQVGADRGWFVTENDRHFAELDRRPRLPDLKGPDASSARAATQSPTLRPLACRSPNVGAKLTPDVPQNKGARTRAPGLMNRIEVGADVGAEQGLLENNHFMSMM